MADNSVNFVPTYMSNYHYDNNQPESMEAEMLLWNNKPTHERLNNAVEQGNSEYVTTYETNEVTTYNKQKLSHLAMSLRENRIFGERVAGRDEVLNILSGKPNNVIGVYMHYCAQEGGLKEPGELTFDNLVDPSAGIKEMRDFNFGSASSANNKEMELLTQAAVKAKNPQMAALMIKNAGAGWGANNVVLDTILKDAKSTMSENEFNRFITETDNSLRKFNGDESKGIGSFIKDNHAQFFFKLFGSNKQGKEYLNIVSNALDGNEKAGNSMMANRIFMETSMNGNMMYEAY